MKKLLLILAIGAFAACNDNTNETESTTDTVPSVEQNTMPPMDTTSMPADTSATADTSAAQ